MIDNAVDSFEYLQAMVSFKQKYDRYFPGLNDNYEADAASIREAFTDLQQRRDQAELPSEIFKPLAVRGLVALPEVCLQAERKDIHKITSKYIHAAALSLISKETEHAIALLIPIGLFSALALIEDFEKHLGVHGYRCGRIDWQEKA